MTEAMDAPLTPPSPVRVAIYLRMSTEHQQYSTENQSDALFSYAKQRGMLIVQTYTDHGKSGLSISGRLGLATLLDDVQTGKADFDAVLVYDVSRWGRFQDADESAYYEYVLKQAGIRVHYCAEPFDNDGSLPSALIKTLKRTMAGEYSRELSVKVFAGHCRMVELGFRQGGRLGFGLRRQLVDQNFNVKQLLADGERKSLQTDRVVVTPGPDSEVEVVRTIFRLFAEKGVLERDIAKQLNHEGIACVGDKQWTRGIVHRILTNPNYVGDNVYNRRSYKLKRKPVRNPPEMWVSKTAAFTPVIPRELFYRVQEIISDRHKHLTDGALLELLRMLLQRAGRISGVIIDEAEGVPPSSVYKARFGSLPRAYTLIGWSPGADYQYIEINRHLRLRHRELVTSIIDQLRNQSASVQQDALTDLLIVNDEYKTSLILARCRTTDFGLSRWVVRFDSSLEPDITIVGRMDAQNESILDYYVFPSAVLAGERLRLLAHNPMYLEVFRFADLSVFSEIARRTPIEAAA